MAEMTQGNASGVNESAEREFVMERVFAAPRALVFRAFTQPEHLKQWWGPKGWTLPVCEIDFREGGTWFYGMRSPDGGMESYGKATYREIVPPERIVYEDAFADAEGNVNAEMPQMVITMTFAEHDGKTTLTSRTLFASAADLKVAVDMGMEQGATETWDRLEAFVTTA